MPRLSDLAGAMSTTRFQPIDRRGTYSEKWEKYAGRDVLPFWVADMDLATAPFVIAAVRERLEHPVLGYTATPTPVVAAFLDWLWRNYRWQVSEDWLVWFPGVVPGFNVAARALADQGEDLLIPAPVYPPFLRVPWQAGLRGVLSPLVRENGRWIMDFDDLAANTSRATAAVLFCNPQNPTGRVYGREELNALAELVVDSETILISDEIHCPLVLDQDRRHIPIASLDAAIEARTVTLFAPTKAYNFPGLGGAVAVIPDATIRERFEKAGKGLLGGVSPLAYAAATAAFADRSTWLEEQNLFLAGNAAIFERAVQDIEGIVSSHVEGTYLAWLDVSALGLANPAACFEAFGLGLSDGEDFGAPGYLRFNLGCGRSLLRQGIERLRRAVTKL